MTPDLFGSETALGVTTSTIGPSEPSSPAPLSPAFEASVRPLDPPEAPPARPPEFPEPPRFPVADDPPLAFGPMKLSGRSLPHAASNATPHPNTARATP